MKQAAASKAPREPQPASLEIHSLAELFPPMSPGELEALTADIGRNGLVEPVVLHEGKVLDGVHRLKACQSLGIEPRFETWNGEAGTPLQFVCSKNWSRRSLTPSQRAVIALAVEREFAAEAKAGRPKRSEKGGINATISGKSRDKAAAVAGVSARYIADAKQLAKLDAKLLEQVRLGGMTLTTAMTKAKRKKEPSGAAAPTHKVRIVFQGHVMASGWMKQSEARELTEELVERDMPVRILAKIGGPKSRMYAEAKTWNPFKGCGFACTYCVPSFQRQCKRQKSRCAKCYDYKPHEHPGELGKVPSTDIVFVCGNSDISFASPAYVRRIVEAIRADNEKHEKHGGKSPKTFYIQSKRPAFLAPFLDSLPENVVLLTTLETNRDEGYGRVAKAPRPSERHAQFKALDYPRKIVTIEPVMDFDTDVFAKWIAQLKPEAVWLGYNSQETAVMLPEPPHRKLVAFAEALLAKGIRVLGKELRGLDMPKDVKRTQG